MSKSLAPAAAGAGLLHGGAARRARRLCRLRRLEGAVDALALGLSKELAGEGVRVNAVRPGMIDTEIHAGGGDPERPMRVGATTPMGRPGTAEEVAEAIVWLLSAAASYVTGAILDVAGVGEPGGADSAAFVPPMERGGAGLELQAGEPGVEAAGGKQAGVFPLRRLCLPR